MYRSRTWLNTRLKTKLDTYSTKHEDILYTISTLENIPDGKIKGSSYTTVLYHLHKISGNSAWNVDGTHRESKKCCPVFPIPKFQMEIPGKSCPDLHILTSSRPLTSLLSQPNASKSARSAQTCTLKSSKWLITFRGCMNVKRVMLLLQIW